jgi:hypothetical protein
MTDFVFFRQLVRRLRAPLSSRTKVAFRTFNIVRGSTVGYARQIIAESGLFDGNWYKLKYPDVGGARVDPLDHYMTVGWREGRNPSPMFSTSAYLKANDDVAAMGINPFLHYVEFGLAEGRDGFGDRQAALNVPASSREFGTPHPCLSLVRQTPEYPVWTRSHDLDENDARLISIGAAAAGYVSDDVTRAVIEVARYRLELFSGCVPFRNEGLRTDEVGPSHHRLLDAWYVNSGRLRSRWTGEDAPFVVRAFQCNPDVGPQLVGETVIVSSLDLLDVDLLNPFFPTLFVVTTTEGEIKGSDLLFFPSLCRGGMHYPELLWASAQVDQTGVDFRSIDRKMAKELLELKFGKALAAVESLASHLTPDAEDSPLFQRDLRIWLSEVLEIDAPPAAATASTDQHPVRQTPGAKSIVRSGGLLLHLPSDAAPTIASLIAHRSAEAGQPDARPAGLLVGWADPSRPGIFIDVPGAVGPALNGKQLAIPWLESLDCPCPTNFPPAAVRISVSPRLGDAELIIPNADETLFASKQARAAITWVLDPQGWDEQLLVQCLHTLALQATSGADMVAWLGTPPSSASVEAQALFPHRTKVYEGQGEAVSGLITPLVGSIAVGTMLHDVRTADCFASMLADELVATASCIMVSAERRGGSVNAAIVDAGAVIQSGIGTTGGQDTAWAVEQLWRGCFPVAQPSERLWATRSDLLQAWQAQQGRGVDGDAIHLCSAVVTSSCPSGSPAIALNPPIPGGDRVAVRVERLIG